MVLTVTLASQTHQQISWLVGELSWLLQTLKTARRYVWLLEYAAGAGAAGPTIPRSRPRHCCTGSTWRGSGFGTRARSATCWRTSTLHLPAGSTVAIVGENGAGKTTLVKLLHRPLRADRRPDHGGRSGPAAVPPRRGGSGPRPGSRTSLGSSCLARENVGVGTCPDHQDPAAVERALVRAQARDVSSTLPAGLETQLGASFDDGAELSGGQWQKLALGRAMMRTAPLLLVLDEPTAALDAQTEHALFERYAGAARRWPATARSRSWSHTGSARSGWPT